MTPQEWAKQRGVELHGYFDEEWDEFLRKLEGEDRDRLAEVYGRLLAEAKELHAALREDKARHPENREQRRELYGLFRQLRTERLHDIRERFENIYVYRAEGENDE